MPSTTSAKKPRVLLDRSSSTPLHKQIEARLEERIQSGEFPAGSPLPSIEALAAEMTVSPMTVRQAIHSLSRKGLLISRQGKGTFLSGLKLDRDFRQVLSFSEEARARGEAPHNRLLELIVRNATAAEALALECEPRAQVYSLRRLRITDDLPLGIESATLNAAHCPEFLERYQPEDSLYDSLARLYNLHVAITDELIEVGEADAESAALLEIPTGAPVFLFTRSSYLDDGRPIEFVRSIYRGDRYRITNRLTRYRA